MKPSDRAGNQRIYVRSVRAINGRTQGWAVLLTLPGCTREYAFVGSWERAMRIADNLARRFAAGAA